MRPRPLPWVLFVITFRSASLPSTMNDPTRRRTLKDLFQAPEPMWLFQTADGRALGPVAEPMLLKGLLRGNLSPQTLVRPVGQPQWRPIAAYTRLTRAIERLQARVSGVRVTR